MDTANLLWGVVFGAIGGGYIVYGRRQRAPATLLCGLALVAFTWFVSSAWAIMLVGAALMAAPFVLQRFA